MKLVILFLMRLYNIPTEVLNIAELELAMREQALVYRYRTDARRNRVSFFIDRALGFDPGIRIDTTHMAWRASLAAIGLAAKKM